MLGVVCMARGEESSPWERFVNEAPTAYAQYREALTRGTTVAMREEIRVEREGVLETLVGPKDSVFTFRSPFIVVEEELVGKDETSGGEYVLAANQQYGFSLERRESDRPWLIRNLRTDDPRALFYENLDAPDASSWPVDEVLLLSLVPVLEVGNAPLDRLLTSAATKIHGTTVDAHGRVAIEFSTEPDQGRVFRLLGGTVWLLPEKSWVISEYDVRSEFAPPSRPVERRGAHRIIDWSEADGIPVPLLITSRTQTLEGEHRVVEGRRTYYDWKLHQDLPERRFTLTHYGLPEPGLDRQGAGASKMFFRSPVVWINLIGLMLIICGIGIRTAALRRPRP